MRGDGGPAKDVTTGGEPTLTRDKDKVLGHDDRVDQTTALNAGRELVKVWKFLTLTCLAVDDDEVDGYGAEVAHSKHPSHV